MVVEAIAASTTLLAEVENLIDTNLARLPITLLAL